MKNYSIIIIFILFKAKTNTDNKTEKRNYKNINEKNKIKEEKPDH